MKALLPSFADLSATSIPAGEDPLGCLMARVVPFNRFAPYPGPETILGVLSVLSQVPFDPNARVASEMFPSTALGAALKCINPNQLQRCDRAWPSSLDGFSGALLQSFESSLGETCHDQVDAEWLAAVILAAGANPWADRGDATYHAGFGSAFYYACRLGLVGLVERMWDVVDGRPTVEELSTTLVDVYRGDRQLVAPLLDHAMLHADTGLARWLLEKGVRPLPDRVHPASQAIRVGHVQALKDHGLLPLDGPGRRALETIWKARLKKGDLSPEMLTDFQEIFASQALAAPQREEQTLVASFEQLASSVAWNSSSYLMFTGNIGQEDLLKTASLPKGPLAGQWNRLSIELLRHVRQGKSRGVMPWDLGNLIEKKEGQPLELTNSTRGLLSSALGVEWKPGVALDGLVALALLGMGDSAQRDASSVCVHPLTEQPLMDKAAGLLGIADVPAWANAHAEASVVFTEAFTKGGSDPACTRLQQVWAAALTRHPTWLADQPVLGLRLLQALTFNFRRVHLLRSAATKEGLLGNSSELGMVIGKLWPDVVSSEVPDLSAISAPVRSLGVEVALMVRSPAWLSSLENAFHTLSATDRQRVEVFEAYARKHLVGVTFEGKPLSNMMRELLLTGALPVPTAALPKPRF